MNVRRGRVGVVTSGSKVYAIGMILIYSKVVLILFDKNLSKIRIKSLLITQLKLFSNIGGYDGMHNLTTIEIYDPVEGTWSMAGKMNRHEGGVGVAALPINCSNWSSKNSKISIDSL